MQLTSEEFHSAPSILCETCLLPASQRQVSLSQSLKYLLQRQAVEPRCELKLTHPLMWPHQRERFAHAQDRLFHLGETLGLMRQTISGRRDEW